MIVLIQLNSASALPEFQFRRVTTSGEFDHQHEMLLGPRGKDGQHGYNVVTPLMRGPNSSPILVNRGFISMSKRDAASRPLSQVGRR